MYRHSDRQVNKARGKVKSLKGMTMAEMLTTVAILVVLMGVSFIAVASYQRVLGQVERDGAAKEIFIAAQNHLTMARGEGYFTATATGSSPNLGTEEKAADGKGTGVYYFVVNSSNTSNLNDEGHAAGMMLPFGSIDETIRGGSYIVRYDPKTARVLDVFYTTESGKFGKKLQARDLDTVKGLVDDEDNDKKQNRRNPNNQGWILGWYGGAATAELPTNTITANDFKLEVTNGDVLEAEVSGAGDNDCTLIIKGVQSGARIRVSLNNPGTNLASRVTNKYEFVIDDIRGAGKHFYDLVKDVNDGGNYFIPGENIEIQAILSDNESKSNIIYSNIETTNSLYGSLWEEKEKGSGAMTAAINAAGVMRAQSTSTVLDDTIHKATVSNIRHLENLDYTVSHTGKDKNDNAGLNLSTVFQTSDISFDSGVYTAITGADNSGSLCSGSFYPVNYTSNINTIGFLYDGMGHKISDINVITGNDGGAGLFGVTKAGYKFKNLQLVDFKVSVAENAGALAGVLIGSNVNNVVAYNTSSNDDNDNSTITASGTNSAAGGLVGRMEGGNMMYSAAALVVRNSGTGTAGGLIGSVVPIGEGEGAQNAAIKACYSSGHTDKGEYYKHDNGGERDTALYNVTGNTAGGLIGNSTDANISACYSTCSVSGERMQTGGFVGNASGGNISNSYCTGLVSGDFAFIGSSDNIPSLADNKYYDIVNEYVEEEEFKYKPAMSTEPSDEEVSPIDESVEIFDNFTGGLNTWHNAVPYDTEIKKYYKEKYSIKSATKMAAEENNKDDKKTHVSNVNEGLGTSYFVNTHYGDWPAPELFVVNN